MQRPDYRWVCVQSSRPRWRQTFRQADRLLFYGNWFSVLKEILLNVRSYWHVNVILDWNYMYYIDGLVLTHWSYVSLALIHRYVVSGLEMTWCWIGDKLVSTTMLTHFADAYVTICVTGTWRVKVIIPEFMAKTRILDDKSPWLQTTRKYRKIYQAAGLVIPSSGCVYDPWIYYTVKPVYNDHLMRYFSAFWSSSRWPRAT